MLAKLQLKEPIAQLLGSTATVKKSIPGRKATQIQEKLSLGRVQNLWLEAFF
jgi:hypothetical protein